MLEGRVWRDTSSSWWFSEIAFLNVLTQGRTRKEALEMIKDAVMELLKDSYENLLYTDFELSVTLYKNSFIKMTASDEKLLLGLGAKRRKLKM